MLELNQQSDGNYRPGHGGDTANVAVAAARQGATVAYLTRLGNDAFGRSFLELWKNEGVDSSHVVVDNQADTGIYFVSHGPSGHQFSYRRKGSAASLMTPGNLPLDVVKTTRMLHVSGISQAISDSAADTVFAAIEMARSADVTVSYDVNYRPSLWPIDRCRAITHGAMALCDIALPGLEDAVALTGLENPDAIVDFYLALGIKTVALTLGPDGVLLATATERHRIAGHVLNALDATGAGDTFDGCFLAELVSGESPLDSAIYANAAAALSTCAYGAVPAIPSRTDVTIRQPESLTV